MNENLIKENKELSKMKENLNKKINDYETQINKYKLDKNNKLDGELNKTKEPNYLLYWKNDFIK
jgi:uncharacterized protein YlxW (UPF0749 family)